MDISTVGTVFLIICILGAFVASSMRTRTWTTIWVVFCLLEGGILLAIQFGFRNATVSQICVDFRRGSKAQTLSETRQHLTSLLENIQTFQQEHPSVGVDSWQTQVQEASELLREAEKAKGITQQALWKAAKDRLFLDNLGVHHALDHFAGSSHSVLYTPHQRLVWFLVLIPIFGLICIWGGSYVRQKTAVPEQKTPV